jgi:hypothetical protein
MQKLRLIPHTRAQQRFISRSFLRSANFLLQNCAIARQRKQIRSVRLTYEKHAAQNHENMRKNSFLHCNHSARTRARSFTVVFYVVKSFGCKTAQFRVTRRECEMAETPSAGKATQAGENARKNSVLNY